MGKINIIPSGNKLIAFPLEKKEEKLESGIYVPETANADLREGEVVCVSPDLKGIFSVGDIVLYPNRKGVSQLFNGVPHIWLDATPEKEEVWGTIKKDL